MEDVEMKSQVDEWEMLMFLYESALKTMRTKIEILNQEYQRVHNHNPIEHIKSRVKSPESIVKKLKKQGLPVNLETMRACVNDIAGIRIICSFTSDIYKIADTISVQKDVQVISVKNYIAMPKPNGYKSYHMVVAVPVYLSDKVEYVKVEIQIRTIAMDFWASLEHKIYYKFEGDTPKGIQKSLKECADMVNLLDERMLQLNEEVIQFNKEIEEVE
ncbi:MAG: GTP pyrophosphokinase family protein [Lachnospiraceae bacterium]